MYHGAPWDTPIFRARCLPARPLSVPKMKRGVLDRYRCRRGVSTKVFVCYDMIFCTVYRKHPLGMYDTYIYMRRNRSFLEIERSSSVSCYLLYSICPVYLLYSVCRIRGRGAFLSPILACPSARYAVGLEEFVSISVSVIRV